MTKKIIKKMTPLLFWLIAATVAGIIILLIEAIIALPASAAPAREPQDTVKKVLLPCWIDHVIITHGTHVMDKFDKDGNFVIEEDEISVWRTDDDRVDENGKPVLIEIEVINDDIEEFW
ncbi:MAG: hypothetical protein LBJ63_02110, partial [Prevotellaceae bacterium]|nr:hypothetical protein [Prevotellaceae bacterium]